MSDVGRTSTSGLATAARERRERLRLLDRCLGAVEDEAERGREVVSHKLAASLRPYAPLIVEGMTIAEAHDAILGVQESSLLDNESRQLTTCLSTEQAHNLCESIRRRLGDLAVLVWRAHQGRAWTALGYKSWDQFVRAELGFSRSRSYQLIDQGSIIATITEAAGVDSGVSLTEFGARCIKPIVNELADEIRHAVSNDPAGDPYAVVAEVVRRGKEHSGSARSRSLRGESVVGRLAMVVKCISGLPPAASVLADLTDEDLRSLRAMASVASWLNEFIAEWSMRVDDSGSIVIGLRSEVPFVPVPDRAVAV